MKRLFFALLILSSISVMAQDAVLLRVNYQPGDTYKLKVSTNADMGPTGFMNSDMIMDMTVKTVDDGIFNTESKLVGIVMAMEQGGMSMTYDSSMKAEDLDQMGQMMKSQFDPMMSATIYTSLDKFGTTVDTRIEPAIAGMEQFSQNSGAISYPKEKVSVGSTWTAEQERQGMTMKINYKVKSIANGNAVLDVTGDMAGTGTGTIKGTTNIDIKSGVQTKSELLLTMSVQGMDVLTTIMTSITKM